MIKLLVTILPVSFAVIFSAYAAPQVTLSLDDIRSPVFSAKAIQVSLAGPQMSILEVKLGEVAVQGKTWRNLRFSCHTFQFSKDFIRCDDGVLRLSKSVTVPAAFNFSTLNKTLDLNLSTTSNEGNEGWRLSARWGGAAWESVLTIANGQIARIAELLPEIERRTLASARGRINGTAKVRGNARGAAAIEANFAVDGLAFSDVSGLHAGENISGEITAKAMRQGGWRGGLWEWQADVT